MMVEVAEHRFKSKKALYERLREILWGVPMGSFVEGADAVFLNAALSSANVFYGYPAEAPIAWRIQKQGMGPAPEFVFIRADGTCENPSIKRLSLQKKKGGKTARMAARRDVVDQILEFRSSRLSGAMMFHCDDCDYVSPSVSDFDVDHDDPTFVDMFEAFLAAHRCDEVDIPVIETKDSLGIMVDYGMAEPFGSRWKRYHAEFAKLQLLCRGCHVHKTFRYNHQGEGE